MALLVCLLHATTPTRAVRGGSAAMRRTKTMLFFLLSACSVASWLHYYFEMNMATSNAPPRGVRHVGVSFELRPTAPTNPYPRGLQTRLHAHTT